MLEQMLQQMMQSNPQMQQVMQSLQQSQDPMALIQQMAGNDPGLQKALELTKGKSLPEIQQYAMNMFQAQGGMKLPTQQR